EQDGVKLEDEVWITPEGPVVISLYPYDAGLLAQGRSLQMPLRIAGLCHKDTKTPRHEEQRVLGWCVSRWLIIRSMGIRFNSQPKQILYEEQNLCTRMARMKADGTDGELTLFALTKY